MSEAIAPSPEAIEEDRQGNPLSIDAGSSPGFRWTIKRRRFCYEFVRNGGKVGKAAEDAGYIHGPQEGSYLLTLPLIRKRIENDLRNHLAANEVNEQSVIARWQNWADASPADYFEYAPYEVAAAVEEEGVVIHDPVIAYQLRLKNLDELSDLQRKALKKIVVRDTQHGQDIQIEVQDQSKANDRLAQTLGMLQTDSQYSNIPPPEDAARMIHDFLQLVDGVDGTGSSEKGSEADGPVEPINPAARSA